MTSDDFRAWLSGFSEAVDGAPTEAQWARVLEKLGQVVPVAPIIPFDFPRPSIPNTWGTWPYGTTSNGTRVVDAVSGRDLGGAE